jgi:putative ABC transport system permease protein
MSVLLQLIWASYKYNKLRVAWVLIALIVACAGLSAVLVINATAKQSYASANQPFLQQVEQRIVARNGHILTKQDFASLRRLGFINLIPVARSTQNIIHPATGEYQQVSLMGIDAFSILSYSVSHSLTNRQNTQDNQTVNLTPLWQPPYASLIHPDFASHLKLLDRQILSLSSGQALPKLQVSAISGLGREIIMDIGQLQQILGQVQISELLLVGENNPSLNSKIIDVLPSHLRLEDLNTGEQAAQLTDSFHLNLLAMACLMFVVCIFVVMNALHLLLMQRWQNLRISRQLGISRKQLYSAHLLELVLICIICAPIGSIVGVFLAQFASVSVSQTLQSLFDVRIGYTSVPYMTLLAQSFTACILGALVASILPMWQLNTKLASRNLANNADSHHAKWLFASIVLGCLSIGLSYFSNTILVSFMAIAFCVFAGCCALIYAVPKLLHSLFKSIPEHWVLCRWLAADGVCLSQKSKIACCAFFIAVTSNVGMNLMVDSFRQATYQWLTQRLVADEYVVTKSPDLFSKWLTTQNLEFEVFERKSLPARLLNQPLNSNYPSSVELRSYPNTPKYQSAMLFAKQQNDVWPEYSSGQGVLVNQQLAFRNRLKLGDDLHFQLGDVQFDSKQLISKKIIGIYYDYGNQSAQALLPIQNFSEVNANTSLFALHFASKSQQDLFAKQLASDKISDQLSMLNVDDLLAVSMQTFDRTFLITDGLNIVTLLVAALSLATSVLMIDSDNRPQRALLRSMGVGNIQIAGLSVIQYGLLSILTCLVALPFGIGLTWLLINLINVQAFSWSYPMLIEPYKLLSSAIASVVLIVIVVALPLYILSRRKLIEDIKCLSFS